MAIEGYHFLCIFFFHLLVQAQSFAARLISLLTERPKCWRRPCVPSHLFCISGNECNTNYRADLTYTPYRAPAIAGAICRSSAPPGGWLLPIVPGQCQADNISAEMSSYLHMPSRMIPRSAAKFLGSFAATVWLQQRNSAHSSTGRAIQI